MRQARFPTPSSVGRVSFRLKRTAEDLNVALATLRRDAAAPGYCGPDINILVRAIADVEILREQLRRWPARLVGIELDGG